VNVIVTGAYGRCGTAIIDHLHDRDEYEFTHLNRSDRPDDHPYGGYDTVVADIRDREAVRSAFEGQDSVVHLAAHPKVDGVWRAVRGPNIMGMKTVLVAARDAEVESFVFGSTNHVLGLYELENASEIYTGSEIMLDHRTPVRPDSYYGTTKSFGEDLGRYYVESFEYPKRFYAIRICTVNDAAYDHPYGDAEYGVDDGDWERDSEEYRLAVERMKAMWHSRHDFAHEVDCCLQDDSVTFDIFSGVSDNDTRWFDIEHARDVIGYDPQDNGSEWDKPPR
jgi:hypothetical protein